MFKWVPISSGVNSAVNYHPVLKIKLTTLLRLIVAFSFIAWEAHGFLKLLVQNVGKLKLLHIKVPCVVRMIFNFLSLLPDF